MRRPANSTPALFTPGTRVKHYTDDAVGTVVTLDTNLIELGYSSTTCTVLWDDCQVTDVQWTNKLLVLTHEHD